jgi:hypothetical protein
VAADAAGQRTEGRGQKTEEEEAPASAIATDVPPADAPVGPSSEEEAAFLAQEREMGIVTPTLMHVEAPPEEKGELPPMEDLVKRIPAPAREVLEELFRARFVTVKRIPQSALKS